MSTYKYSIDDDTGCSTDSGPFRSYHLEANGNTLAELLANATISEIDQDGGDRDCYGLHDAPGSVEVVALRMIENEIIYTAQLERMDSLHKAAPELVKVLRLARSYVEDPGNNPQFRNRDTVLAWIDEALRTANVSTAKLSLLSSS